MCVCVPTRAQRQNGTGFRFRGSGNCTECRGLDGSSQSSSVGWKSSAVGLSVELFVNVLSVEVVAILMSGLRWFLDKVCDARIFSDNVFKFS